NVSNDFSKPVTAQILPTQKKSCLKNTNVLALGMYKIHTNHTQARTSQLPQDSKKTNKRVSFSTGVIPLNAKTVNVKYVSAMCAKCVMIDKHNLCVPKSVAKPLRKTVASESIKKPRNNVRKLHERFEKIYKWTYIKFTPSGRSIVSNTPLSFNSFAAHRDCSIHRRLWVLKAHNGKSQASN
nr:hypothetical protein [Tanacetum cinerariifolium]